ncbi:LysR substrate-binding domain-containing protein [Catellatospora sichuanensis]|uniref:LysR substrate-binding domain-containing protein n=1 Tax=Catellatospora sichuanensis TaxID=1969805 RepID=UPI001FEBC429|nr:LysR substrate-binding domain-containing protein [Catellatospora sichuanensis]
MPDDRPPATFRLLVVPGVTMDKWSRLWSERQPKVGLELVPVEVAQAAALLSAEADAGLLRLPVDQDAFHAISLYTETTVVVVQREHLFAAADEVTVADLADETLLLPDDGVIDWTGPAGVPGTVAEHRPATTADAVELVAAGVGVLVVPQSLARAHHRRDLTYRVISDAPTSSVALVWSRDRYTDLVEEMIGIVRGRTANSTRGRTPAEPPAPAARSTNRPKPATGQTGARRSGTNPRTPPKRRGR